MILPIIADWCCYFFYLYDFFIHCDKWVEGSTVYDDEFDDEYDDEFDDENND